MLSQSSAELFPSGSVFDESVHCDSDIESDTVNWTVNENAEHSLNSAEQQNLMLTQFALFTLNLRTKHHVAESVVQTVLDNFNQLTTDNMQAVEQKMLTILG